MSSPTIETVAAKVREAFRRTPLADAVSLRADDAAVIAPLASGVPGGDRIAEKAVALAAKSPARPIVMPLSVVYAALGDLLNASDPAPEPEPAAEPEPAVEPVAVGPEPAVEPEPETVDETEAEPEPEPVAETPKPKAADLDIADPLS